MRRPLPRRTTYNVLCELGDPDAERTIVVIAHHDSAHSGLVFHPQLPLIADRLGLIERTDTSPALMAPVIGGPILAVLGALSGRRLLAKVGLLLGLGSAATMAEIGARRVVPGANDNGTSVVALLALAHRFLAEPPAGVRVILLSAGSEESFSEGMKAFGERHFASLPRESTFFLCLESIGSPHLLVIRGEGFLKMHEYPPPGAGCSWTGWPKRSASGSTRTCACTTAPTASSRWGPATRPPVARRLQRPQATGQLPLAERPRRERRLRHRRQRHPPLRGRDPPPRDHWL